METKTIDPSPDEECCCCHIDNVLLHVFEDGYGELRKEHQHCGICYSTLIGNTCVYKFSHEHGHIHQSIAACTNIILKAMAPK